MTDVNEEAWDVADAFLDGSHSQDEVKSLAAMISTALAAAEKRGELKGARARTNSAWDVAQDSVMRLDTVACFTCKAKPDEPCWDTVRNGPASGTHLTRIADALKKFRDAHLAEIEERSATDKPSLAR